jgi:hypothetical protein
MLGLGKTGAENERRKDESAVREVARETVRERQVKAFISITL